jgi:hypothetical protein
MLDNIGSKVIQTNGLGKSRVPEAGQPESRPVARFEATRSKWSSIERVEVALASGESQGSRIHPTSP